MQKHHAAKIPMTDMSISELLITPPNLNWFPSIRMKRLGRIMITLPLSPPAQCSQPPYPKSKFLAVMFKFIVICACAFCFMSALHANEAEGVDHYVASSGGVKIHYKCFGKGEPLLIINGGPGLDCAGFIPLAKMLATNYRTIIYDQRGTGQSSIPKPDKTTVTLDLMNDDIEAIRKDLNLKSLIILGHSFGGMMGGYYTSKYPEHVKAIIFSGSGGLTADVFRADSIQLRPTTMKDRQMFKNSLDPGLTKKAAKKQLRLLVLAAGYVYDNKHAFAVSKRLGSANRVVYSLIRQEIMKKPLDCRPALAKFRKPVLNIQGEYDCINKRIAEMTLKTIPHAKMMFLENCGHYGWLEQKGKYLKAVCAFIDSVIKSQP